MVTQTAVPFREQPLWGSSALLANICTCVQPQTQMHKDGVAQHMHHTFGFLQPELVQVKSEVVPAKPCCKRLYGLLLCLTVRVGDAGGGGGGKGREWASFQARTS